MEKKSLKPQPFIYPLPALLVSCGSKPEDFNLLTVSWAGTLCSNPPLCYISVRPERHSHKLLMENMEYVINLTTTQLLEATDCCGIISGKDVNKFEATGLTPSMAEMVSAPIVMEAPLSIECRVKEVISLGSHDMFVSEVINILADTRYIDPETGKFSYAAANPLVYAQHGYYGLGELLGTYGYTAKK